MTCKHEGWSYVRPAQQTCDGWLAYLGLKAHYLGINNVDNMASTSKAERAIHSATYHGELCRWNFERYVKVHVDNFNIIKGLTEHGHASMDPRSRVRHLVDGIKTTALDTIKAQIFSSADLRTDFKASGNLFQDFIKQSPSTADRDSRVVALQTTMPNPPKVEPDMSVEDRYYNVLSTCP